MRAVDHHRDQLGSLVSLIYAGADMGAVAQHRDAVGELEDLLHAMADIDDGHAFALQPADQRKSCADSWRGQIGGRLVEDQKLRAAHGRARRGDELLLADGQARKSGSRPAG